jgi:hypothetical protein
MTDPLNALRRSSGKSSSGLKPERAAPSVHSATRRSVGGVAVNVAGDVTSPFNRLGKKGTAGSANAAIGVTRPGPS